jgi:thioredoxin reductase
MNTTNPEIIIIGGSYAGLSAALALGRAARNVLIIDSQNPCNKQTPHSHNFLTCDGETPKAIAQKAREQVLGYDTVRLHVGLVTVAQTIGEGFSIHTETGEMFTAKKLLFATGVRDQFDTPQIQGLAECWGISVLHCPYCHGYEVRNEQLGVLGNGDAGFEFVRLISQWTKQLTLFTNGASTLSMEQMTVLERRKIAVVEREIVGLEHSNGQIHEVCLKDGTRQALTALFARIPFRQHCDVPQTLGCEITEQGYIKVDSFQKTSLHGVYAAGDSTTMMRSVSAAVAAGTMAGAMLNRELIEEAW